MNYLAHFHLAGDDGDMLLGALLGDFVKGPLDPNAPPASLQAFARPEAIVRGIQLHRKIDAFVDQTNALTDLQQQIPGASRRCQGILLDLFSDYALANRWQQFDDRPLDHYAAHVLDALHAEQHALPDAASLLLQRMQRYQLLVNYRKRETIASIAERIGIRLGMREAMLAGLDSLWSGGEQCLLAFEQGYPLIVNHSATMREQLQQAGVSAAQRSQ